MKCWNCGGSINDNPFSKISFRAECEACSAALHCCKNCKYYRPGQPNDCAVPNTDFIADRTAPNFCEEFKVLGTGPSAAKQDPGKVARQLFGDDVVDPPIDPKTKFNKLFDDHD